jgi:hypothetical protein
MAQVTFALSAFSTLSFSDVYLSSENLEPDLPTPPLSVPQFSAPLQLSQCQLKVLLKLRTEGRTTTKPFLWSHAMRCQAMRCDARPCHCSTVHRSITYCIYGAVYCLLKLCYQSCLTTGGTFIGFPASAVSVLHNTSVFCCKIF